MEIKNMAYWLKKNKVKSPFSSNPASKIGKMFGENLAEHVTERMNKKLTGKLHSEYKPQSQMTEEERALYKGIKKPQSIK